MLGLVDTAVHTPCWSVYQMPSREQVAFCRSAAISRPGRDSGRPVGGQREGPGRFRAPPAGGAEPRLARISERGHID